MAHTANELLAGKIRLAIAQSKMDKKDIADAVGVTKQSVTGWEVTGRISKTSLNKLASLLHIEINWFLSDEADVNTITKRGNVEEVSERKQDFDQNVTPVAMGKRPIPVISAIQAGAMTDMVDPYPLGAGYAVEYVDDDYSKWAFALTIEGDSMLPEYRAGDRVLIEPELTPNPGDCVICKNGKDQATFKKYRLRGIDDNGNEIFDAVPLNPDYQTLHSDTDHLQIIGVMVEHRRRIRRR